MKLSYRYATELKPLVSKVSPKPLQDMRLALVNRELATDFALPESWWEDNFLAKALEDPDFALSKYAVAQKYGGHQFGHWNPQLGDGRGLLLAEVTSRAGDAFDLHLKGAGPTPYSRHADGRAVLRSTIREYIGGEALHYLGIPSSRSLCLFSSKQTVRREQPEPGAMMIRTAPSHIRFGHFEYYYHTSQQEELDALMEYTLSHHFPECRNSDNPHAAMLKSITLRTARLIALWQAHGFVHGVMNTDNMSVHGITFDYGPYAFIDTFMPSAVFNHSDYEGRYAYDRQPGIGLWNLNALAQAFTSYVSATELGDILKQFEPAFIQQYQMVMTNRMGFNEINDSSLMLLNRFMSLLTKQQDYTSSFRQLALTDINEAQPSLRDQFVDRPGFDSWWQDYRTYLSHQTSTQGSPDNGTLERRLAQNPAVIPRTHILQEAISAAEKDDWSVCESLLEAVRHPYDQRWDDHRFAQPPQNPQQVSLSCSS